MYGLECLLLNGFHRHRTNLTAASRFQECVGVGAVRLAASDVGPHVLDRQELHPEATGLHPASPIVRGAARFHDHVRVHDQRVDESLELAAREALTIDDPAGAIGHRDLEHVFGKIDRDGGRIHNVSSSLSADVCQRPRAMMPENREESMPSVFTV
jgi:hypothetical protein